MGFMLELPSLDERVMSDQAVQVLFAIAEKEEAMLPARFEILKPRFVGGVSNFSKSIYGLLNAEYISEKVGVHSREAFTLTDKGWAVVGDKPMWMA